VGDPEEQTRHELRDNGARTTVSNNPMIMVLVFPTLLIHEYVTGALCKCELYCIVLLYFIFWNQTTAKTACML
jgi:hypothetical protein